MGTIPPMRFISASTKYTAGAMGLSDPGHAPRKVSLAIGASILLNLVEAVIA